MNYFSRNNVPIPDAAFEHHRKLIAEWVESGDANAPGQQDIHGGTDAVREG
jgi:hypothetical protein